MSLPVAFQAGDLVIIPEGEYIDICVTHEDNLTSTHTVKIKDYLNMSNIFFRRKYNLPKNYDRSINNSRILSRGVELVQLISPVEKDKGQLIFEAGDWVVRSLPIEHQTLSEGVSYSLNKYPTKKLSPTKKWIKVVAKPIVWPDQAFERWYPICEIFFTRIPRLVPYVELHRPMNNWDKNTFVWWEVYNTSHFKNGYFIPNLEYLDDIIFLPFAVQMDSDDNKKLKNSKGPGWLVKIKNDKWRKENGSGRSHFQNENYLHIDTYQENGFDYFYVPLTQISISLHCPVTFDESLSVLGNGVPCEIQPIK